ncbi:hypothetical protein [Phyllobacterium brassicacearum]|uniref:hypothetical protein n=1 Tax=Phyllobacterium brassicacearum TaxID=314235 RepID=UPI0014731506|nr:hypothetical protein [Phyllobacterium brassicacearum]
MPTRGTPFAERYVGFMYYGGTPRLQASYQMVSQVAAQGDEESRHVLVQLAREAQ